MCSLSILMWLKQHCVSCIQGLQYAFLQAAYKGDLDKVKDLIGQGCPVNTTDEVKFAVTQIHRKVYIACFHRACVALSPTPPHAHAHTHHHSVSHLYSHCDLFAWLLHCAQVHMSACLLPVIHCTGKVHFQSCIHLLSLRAHPSQGYYFSYCVHLLFFLFL